MADNPPPGGMDAASGGMMALFGGALGIIVKALFDYLSNRLKIQSEAALLRADLREHIVNLETDRDKLRDDLDVVRQSEQDCRRRLHAMETRVSDLEARLHQFENLRAGQSQQAWDGRTERRRQRKETS